MAYVGTPIDTTNQFQSLQGKRFDGDGSTTAFTLDIAPSSVFDIEVFVDNVRQDPNSAYALSGTTMTFTSAPASGTNNIYVIHQAKSVGTIDLPEGALVDLNGGSDKLVLDADGDTTISADTDDQIDFKVAGNDRVKLDNTDLTLQTCALRINNSTTGTTSSDGLLLEVSGSEVYFNQKENADIHVRTNNTDRVIISGSGNVGIGEDVPEGKLHIFTGDASVGPHGDADELVVEGSGASGISILSGSSSNGNILFGDSGGDEHGAIRYLHANDNLRFDTADAEVMRINHQGMVMIGDNTADSISNNGVNISRDSQILVSRAGGDCGTFNRNSDDGQILNFAQAGSTEGNISVSGSTVSYNGFTGTHWSRLTDNSKPTILKGTILESLDTMMDWYQAVATIAEVKDDDGNVITPERKVKKSISLDGKNVGDAITFTSKEKEYTGVIEKELDVKHVKCKISDSAESKNIYGLFQAWDNDDDTVNDMYVAQVGTFVIRIHKDETVSKGDLIQSKGDGTGKVQADDIMRSSTVAKVLSTTKIETYSDGSYIVPCSLHC